MTSTSRQAAGLMVLVGLLAGTTGCDWWPPTLQERIGQQEAELKVLAAERTRMQAKVTELTKALDEVRAQASKLEQDNAALQTQVEQLKVAVAEAEAKAVKPKAVAPAKRKK
jgi:peptidoglycan hydrolase CwlO-like protein